MSRARATALALVNWKGVFYERYALDRHVTALEGANGAGKTTVMIAAYVVLLPDMSRLKFTNVGETGATGGDKGIWGRLGEIGRPSYAALELELGRGERLIAGIHLERKAEPSVVPTPFVIRNLDANTRLQDVLLITEGNLELVPDLKELKANASRLGAELEVFSTTKEYFAALFDRGVTPLRLSTDEERNKLNEMLRASMTGGISRALTTELRSFLLKEETGLSDTLGRMRANLDACRRTRTEVGESRRLEHEITGIYDAGQAMFAAYVLGVRERSLELGRRVELAVSAHEEAKGRIRELDMTAHDAVSRRQIISERLLASRKRAGQVHAQREGLRRALSTAQRLTEIERNFEAATASAEAARAAQTRTANERVLRTSDREQARGAYDRAALGLADLQKGLEELHRIAHIGRHARKRLDEARAALEEPLLDVEQIPELLERIQEQQKSVDAERARRHRAVESWRTRRQDWERARFSLVAIAGQDVSEEIYERARRELARLSELELTVARLPALAQARNESEALAERQRMVRERARELGFTTSDTAASATLSRELAELERELRSREAEAYAAQLSAREARLSRQTARDRERQLEDQSARFRALSTILSKLETSFGKVERSRDGVSNLRRKLADERQEHKQRSVELERRREELLSEVGKLEASHGGIHPDLLLIRDELDAELLASRFEDVALEEAPALEARLGPLAHALVVEDPAAAAKSLLGKARELEHVWFVAGGTAVHEAPAIDVKRDTGDVIVESAEGVRLSRIPAQPTLGRRARERRIAELAKQADAATLELERTEQRLRLLDTATRDADTLLADIVTTIAPDPDIELTKVRADLESALATEQESEQTRDAADERARTLRQRIDGLRSLFSDALLLDPPDHAARARELEPELRRARAAGDEVSRLAEPRKVLMALLDVLAAPPPTEAELDTWAKERETLEAERDRLFRAAEALEEVFRNRHVLDASDPEQALAEHATLVPALEAQHAAARSELQLAEQAVRDAETNWETATLAFQTAEAERGAIQAHAERLRADLASEGLGEVSDTTLALAEQATSEVDAELSVLELEDRALATDTAVYDERRSQLERAAVEAEKQLAREQREAEPAELRWTNLRDAAERASVLHTALARADESGLARGSLGLLSDARSKLEVLVDRLASARGGASLASEIQGLLSQRENADDAYLDVWLRARDWLKCRLPAQVAEVDEPLEALDRLRDHLTTLEERLGRQESDLRGASEDVARSIEVQLRRAKGQVRRLNQSLDGVRFGSIRGIRVQMRRVERMDQVLRALREGAAQELLFQPNLPIEDALSEIFQRYGGGRSGGQRILDYREYVELIVEVQRRTEEAWEPANPTRLSTGEAIGVGAALMMVVLTEWERDANLLRGKREGGTLRFLFLDEANRLSQDNLGVLFDLCETLDLQLLIAAPEVARAEGNTTYRLVRRVSDDGREEVIVSGRRSVVAEAPEIPAGAAQAELFAPEPAEI